MDLLQNYLDLAAGAPPERDGRHFRTWQRVSVQVQREVRSLTAENFFGQDWRSVLDLERAYTIVVYSSCQPCYGRRPMDFTYDIDDLVTLSTVLRLIGRSMQTRLAQISAGIESDAILKRRFLPVWHMDILQAVKTKPRTLIEILAREAIMINALIELGTMRNQRTTKRFVKSTESAARLLGLDSSVLQDLVLRTGAEYLINGRIFEDDDALSPGSPDARVGRDEDRNNRRSNGGGQVANSRIVSDIQVGG
jgi:hypothetical protein